MTWTALPPSELRTRIAENLEGFDRREIAPANRRLAAVAIVVSPYRRAPTFILTRRALTMRRNAGNYALRGGNLEPGEDAIEALEALAALIANRFDEEA